MNTILNKIFKEKLSLKTILIVLLMIIAVETCLDLWLLDYSADLDFMKEIHYTRFIIEYFYYFITIFLVATFVLSKLVKKTFTNTANFMIRLYTIILLPITLDVLVFNSRVGYNYTTVENFFMNLLTLTIASGDVTNGITVTGIIASIAIFIYIFVQKKSLSFAFIGTVAFATAIIVVSTPDFVFGKGNGDYYFDYFLPLYYFIPVPLFMIYLYGHSAKKEAKQIFTKGNWKATIISLVLFLVGIAISRGLSQEINIFSIVAGLITIILINQLYKTQTKTNNLKDHHEIIFYTLALMIFFNSLFINYIVVAISMATIGLMYLYKNKTIPPKIALSLMYIASFFYGFFL